MPSFEGIYNKKTRENNKQMGIRQFLGPLNKNDGL